MRLGRTPSVFTSICWHASTSLKGCKGTPEHKHSRRSQQAQVHETAACREGNIFSCAESPSGGVADARGHGVPAGEDLCVDGDVVR
jgi:hypothetical protein